jgi:hypothetical protein
LWPTADSSAGKPAPVRPTTVGTWRRSSTWTRPANRTFSSARSQIQQLQQLWLDRDRYVSDVLKTASSVGYATYERLLLGLGHDGEGSYLALSSNTGTVEQVAAQLLTAYPGLESAMQLAEGGATGILQGTLQNWRVLGPSNHRRDRVLCCLLITRPMGLK